MKFVFISGGTASGKTTFAEKLQTNLHCDKTDEYMDNLPEEEMKYDNQIINDIEAQSSSDIVLISVDMYYPEIDLTKIDIEKHNFDEPQALDVKLFIKSMIELVEENKTSVPLHDFATTKVTLDHQKIDNPHVVIVEGMMLHTILDTAHELLTDEELKELNLTRKEVFAFTKNILKNADNIFVKAKKDEAADRIERLERRIKRDLVERGRSKEETVYQWNNSVIPGHNKHVKPQENLCEILVVSDNFEHMLELLSKKMSKKTTTQQINTKQTNK